MTTPEFLALKKGDVVKHDPSGVVLTLDPDPSAPDSIRPRGMDQNLPDWSIVEE